MEFRDLKAQYLKLKDNIDARVLEVMKTARYIGGPEVKEVTMPNLVGMSKTEATAALTQLNLQVGSITEVESDYDAGTIVWQNVAAGEKLAENSIVYLKVSTGPNGSSGDTESTGG